MADPFENTHKAMEFKVTLPASAGMPEGTTASFTFWDYRVYRDQIGLPVDERDFESEIAALSISDVLRLSVYAHMLMLKYSSTE